MRSSYHVLIGVIAGFLLAGAMLWVSRSPSGQPIELQASPTQAPIVVHVVGAVPRPGVYEFPEGSRVRDAIQAAGGLLASASADSINLAALLEDGQRLEVPFKGNSSGAAAPQAAATSNLADNPDLVDINTATLEELDALPGIGPTTAQKIIDYRTENGPFQATEDIMNVSGIGPATFEELKDLITV
jgi:competence protein ComEA